jgi:aryl-alcohol dehydrogenase-like predicted oxidoreductase
MTLPMRTLGRTGLQVSPLTLGSMQFGSLVDEAEAVRLTDMAIEAGINSFDTANCYTNGRSEEILGRALGKRRAKIVLATKFSVPMDPTDANAGGTSRRNVIAACEASLRRLGTDYIDLYYIHRPFTQTAIDETLRALDDLVRAGKILSIGTSSFAGWQVVQALWCAKDLHLNRPVVEQAAYSLLDRRAERELVPAALTHGVGLTVWSPLVGGLLTGKYLGGNDAKVRLSRDDAAWGARHFTPAADAAVAALSAVAQKANTTLTAMSLAWTLQRPGIASVVLGPRNSAQFAEQLAAQAVTLDADLLAEIDTIVSPGGVTVPYFLDDSWADFRPQPFGW